MSQLPTPNWLQLRSHTKDLSVDLNCPFPVGVEYYRPPVPPTEFWDEDFRRIRHAGMHIVRTFCPWNWVETEPNHFRFEDLDLMFELAAKHDLRVWLDTPVGTHMACPEWMIRQHPDMAVVRQDGSVQSPGAKSFAAQGVMIHNFDHPMWRVYVERYLRAMVPRYKDHPAMGVWGTWDGINFAAAWAGGEGYPPYNDYTIAKYKVWLKSQYTLAELNQRLLRRYSNWEDIEAPRSNHAIVEMLLYRQFHYQNMTDHLGWMADLIDRLDGKHEQRSHGASYPRQQDEIASPVIDSWGLSHGSADRLSTDEPYSIAGECFGFQWCRAVGRNNRWWNEEIYSSFVGGLSPRGKRTIPEESTLFLWLSLIEGAAGALYWQYRPEYMTFEAPGLNLVSLDGEATARWTAVQKAIGQIGALAPHLPLSIPRAEMAVGYSAPSLDVFFFAQQDRRFEQELRALYRALWPASVPMDIVSPSMDWSGYKLVYLPNFALLDEVAIDRLRAAIGRRDGPRLIVDGHFGSFSGKGHWSFHPPEGLHDLIDARVADFDRVTDMDIRGGRNVLKTEFGEYSITRPCQYAILEPNGSMRVVATLGDDVVGVQSKDGRLTWFGLSLSVSSTSQVSGAPNTPPPIGAVHPELALPLVRTAGISPWFEMDGDPVVAFRRGSHHGGDLVFVLNVEPRKARCSIKPKWSIRSATDLIHDQSLDVSHGSFDVEVPFGQVAVIHCGA